MTNSRAYGVYRVFKNGLTRYCERSATHSLKLAQEIADDFTAGRYTLPTGAINTCKAYPHIVRAIADDEWNAGFDAAANGVKWHENPNESGSRKAYAWDEGHTYWRKRNPTPIVRDEDEEEISESEMLECKRLAELNGWQYVVSRMAGNPTFQHSHYGIVMADNWKDLCEQYVFGNEEDSE